MSHACSVGLLQPLLLGVVVLALDHVRMAQRTHNSVAHLVHLNTCSRAAFAPAGGRGSVQGEAQDLSCHALQQPLSLCTTLFLMC